MDLKLLDVRRHRRREVVEISRGLINGCSRLAQELLLGSAATDDFVLFNFFGN